jgi:uncharacterized protein
MTANMLAAETSPYLLQHKDNPVHWRAWSPDVLDEAQESNKPILLSIGYAACHWCHVMAHESFEDPAIAELMNELFVNIKVDREERPDLDAIYQTALALTGQQGGWPLTMFLTPTGEPFWGGTYFPATSRYGRPAFPEMIRQISDTYHAQRDKVLGNAKAITEAVTNASRPEGTGELSVDLLDKAAAAALRMVDSASGGTLGAPKFPQPLFFKFLWHDYRRTGSAMAREAVTLTLGAISQGGIYDHLGGGFARYATDDAWLVPHFEKMLYDNALLLELMTEVWQETRDPLLKERARETVDWILGDMRVSEGDALTAAFASARDADSEGEEGRYYVWTEAEIDTCLGNDAAPFKAAYDVGPTGNWEGRTILNRSQNPTVGNAAAEDLLARGRERLLSQRATRVAPLRDDKALADWNGLMISALAFAGRVFDQPTWSAAARDAFAFVRQRMVAEGRLGHSWRQGKLRHPAVLDDYANMSRAALLLFELSGERDYLDQAVAWVAIAEHHYWDDQEGGYFLAADDTPNLISRTKTAFDNATPSGNGTMVEVLARLAYLTGEDSYRRRAEEVVRTFAGLTEDHLPAMPVLLMGYALLDGAVQVAIVGAPDDDATRTLVRCVLDAPLPNRVLLQVAPGADLPQGHPAHGKTAIGGVPTAYVCVGPRCGLPATTAEDLKAQLSAL